MSSYIVDFLSILWRKAVLRDKLKLSSLKQHIGFNSVIRCEQCAQVELGKVYAREHTYISAVENGMIRIGSDVHFNRNCSIVCRDSISVGDGCIFGPNVYIYDHDHRFDQFGVSKSEYTHAPVDIGRNCWIGANAVILKGTSIGENCVIGAGVVLGG